MPFWGRAVSFTRWSTRVSAMRTCLGGRCAGMRRDWSEPSETRWPRKPDHGRLWHSRPPREGIRPRCRPIRPRRRRSSPRHGKGSTLILKEAPKNYSSSNPGTPALISPMTSRKVVVATPSGIHLLTTYEVRRIRNQACNSLRKISCSLRALACLSAFRCRTEVVACAHRPSTRAGRRPWDRAATTAQSRSRP
jgi:hypothetical protein